MAARPYAIVSPDSPEGEERGRWDTGDSSMSDNTAVTFGTVLRLQDDLKKDLSNMARDMRERLDDLKGDEDARHKLHQERADKSEKLFDQLNSRIGVLESDKRRTLDAFYILRWVLGGIVAAIFGLTTFAYTLATGQNKAIDISVQLLTTLQRAGQERQQQYRSVQEELQGLKQELQSQGEPPK